MTKVRYITDSICLLTAPLPQHTPTSMSPYAPGAPGQLPRVPRHHDGPAVT